MAPICATEPPFRVALPLTEMRSEAVPEGSTSSSYLAPSSIKRSPSTFRVPIELPGAIVPPKAIVVEPTVPWPASVIPDPMVKALCNSASECAALDPTISLRVVRVVKLPSTVPSMTMSPPAASTSDAPVTDRLILSAPADRSATSSPETSPSMVMAPSFVSSATLPPVDITVPVTERACSLVRAKSPPESKFPSSTM